MVIVGTRCLGVQTTLVRELARASRQLGHFHPRIGVGVGVVVHTEDNEIA